jgi:hypothetical protein
MKIDYYLPPGVRIHSGHVYLIAPVKPRKGWTDGVGKHEFKIGVSKSIKGVYNRLKDLNTGNWVELTVANISPEVVHPYLVELFLHANYAKRKIRGEWFKLSYAEYQYIVDLLDKEPDAFDSMRERGKFIKEHGPMNHYMM